MIVFLIPIAFVFVGWLFFGNKTENPYIKTHKRKWKNERDYQEYLRWLDKKGGDSPLNEVKFVNDLEILKEVEKHINR